MPAEDSRSSSTGSHRPHTAHQMVPPSRSDWSSCVRAIPVGAQIGLRYRLAKDGVTPAESGGHRPGVGPPGLDQRGPTLDIASASTAVGSAQADGAVADGRGGRGPVGRRHRVQGPHRHRRPLPVLCLRRGDGAGHRPGRCAASSPRPSSATGCPRRSSPTTARCSPTASDSSPPRCCSTRSAGRTASPTASPRPRSPTTTGKIERFHRTLRTEFLSGQVFPACELAQQELDAWVADYNTERPHQAWGWRPPRSASRRPRPASPSCRSTFGPSAEDRSGDDWVSRTVLGERHDLGLQPGLQRGQAPRRRHHRRPGHRRAARGLAGMELLKTVLRTSKGVVRKKRAETPRQSNRRCRTSADTDLSPLSRDCTGAPTKGEAVYLPSGSSSSDTRRRLLIYAQR